MRISGDEENIILLMLLRRSTWTLAFSSTIPQWKDTAGTTPFLGGCDKPQSGIFKNWPFIILAPHKHAWLWGCGCMSLCIPRVFLMKKGKGCVFVFYEGCGRGL